MDNDHLPKQPFGELILKRLFHGAKKQSRDEVMNSGPEVLGIGIQCLRFEIGGQMCVQWLLMR